jgi:hypothetical protein
MMVLGHGGSDLVVSGVRGSSGGRFGLGGRSMVVVASTGEWREGGSHITEAVVGYDVPLP